MSGRSIILPSFVAAVVGLAIVFAPRAEATNGPPPQPVYDTEVAKADQAMLARPAEALEAAKRALSAARAKTSPEPDEVARTLWLQAEALLRLGRPSEASKMIEGAHQQTGRNDQQPLQANILLTRGGIRLELGETAGALADFQQAYRLFRLHGDARKQAIALAALASLHREGTDYASALKYYGRVLDIYQGDPVFSISIMNNRGNVFSDLDRHREAIDDFRSAYVLAEDIDSALRPLILRNLARSQRASGDLEGATRSITAGLRLAEGATGARARMELRGVAARVALDRGEIGRALSLIDGVFADVDLTATTLAARDNHRTAYMVYERAGRTADALAHLKALRRLDEQATEIATSTRAALMSARFDFANQELQIANLKAEELRRNVAFERSRTRFQQIIFAGIVAASIIVLALLAYNLFTVRRSRNQVRAANTELEATNVRLEKALAAKTEFLATTSHEIRTPLNGILGMTQVMLADGTLAGKLRDRIGIVHGAGLTMKALVDDILDVAKMETGHLSISLEPTDLPATLREVTRMWEEQAHSKGLAFALDIAQAPRWIETDPGRLRQIVFNLLSNALKFTEQGGITLRVATRGEGEAARLRISVRDTGIGIPPEKQADIFESFKQVDAGTTRRFGGTGLGLAICRNLARALGGDIGCESVAEEGATFTLDIPLRPAQAPEGAADEGEGGALLILDRNPINRSMLRTLLEARAGRVHFAASAEEAAEMLAKGGFAHVLIDDATVRGGDADPLALIGKVAAAASGAGAVSAVLWKQPSDEERRRLGETALDLVIAKPVAGAAMADALFGSGPGRGNPPLVSRAA